MYVRRKGAGWVCEVKVGGVRRSMTFRRKADAQDWGQEQERAVRRREYVDTRQSERARLSDLIERWREEVFPRRAKSSQISDTHRVDRLVRDLGDQTLAGLTAHQVVEYAASRGVSSDALRKELAILRDVITSAAEEWGYPVPANAVDQAQRLLKRRKVLRPGAHRERRLEPGEWDALLAVPLRSDTWIRPIAIIALETAMRRGEICNMDRAHRDGPMLVIPETKTGTPRTIPLTDLAVETLDSIPGQGRYFPLADPHSISTAWRRWCRRAGVTGLRFHDLRHEATSRLFERGLQIHQVALVTGHRSWASLKRYTQVRAEDVGRLL